MRNIMKIFINITLKSQCDKYKKIPKLIKFDN